MHLERVHAGETNLAGWISSNDVTLFSVVMVVVVALFLHASLRKGKSENTRLAQQNEELAGTNQQIRQELDATGQRWQATNALLTEAERQRDALDARLAGALQQVASLDASLASLAGQKKQLDTSHAELRVRAATLAVDKASLAERLAGLAEDLQRKVLLLGDVETQRDRLRQQADALERVVARLESELQLAQEDAQQMRQRLTTTEDRSRDDVARLQQATQRLELLQAERNQLQSQVGELADRVHRQEEATATIRRELVGLAGPLRRVVILFDASESMKQRGTSGDDRWQDARQIVQTWLAHLDVEACALIVFSSDVRSFPGGGAMLDLRDRAGAANRVRLMDYLSEVKPQGWTNTLDALRAAYQYPDLDTILLFSDGAPSSPTTGRFDPLVAQQIYALCYAHHQIPVNTIGLGNYFDRDMATFLRAIARLTGGTFRGR